MERVFAYAIDRDDAVASVSDDWLAFAVENRATDLTRDRVVGRALWDFIAGTETRLLYEGLFRRVREGAEHIELPFRCDSPDRFRFMRLLLAPGSEGSIQCEGVLLREQKRPYYSILDRVFTRSHERITMCSLCKRIHAFELRWLELEDAIRELDLFDSADLPEVTYAVCDACASIDGITPDGAANQLT